MSYFRTLVWQPAEGPPINLTDREHGRRLLADGTTGLDMASYTYSERRIPGRAGAIVTSVRAEPRDIDLALLIEGNGETDLRQRRRELVRAMRPTVGPGTLLSVHRDGSIRRISCRYVDGLEGDESSSVTMPGRWLQVIVGLHAEEPYARSEALEIPWSLSPTVSGWFPEIPIRLDASGVGGRQVVHNPGDVEAFPVIVVHGPGTALEVVNRTTGKGLHLDYSIPVGGTVTIDTRPGEQTITGDHGVNLFSSLTDEDPSLWSLQPGDNEIDVRMGASSSASRVTVRFEPLYESL